jgi:hypothetical protein
MNNNILKLLAIYYSCKETSRQTNGAKFTPYESLVAYYTRRTSSVFFQADCGLLVLRVAEVILLLDNESPPCNVGFAPLLFLFLPHLSALLHNLNIPLSFFSPTEA